MTAQRISQLFPSGIRAVMAAAQERERQGIRVIHMEVGQPHFDTPAHIRAAVAAALVTGIPGYTPNMGLLSLREAVAERISGRLGAPVGPSSVCITSGAVMALSLAVQATVDPGDEVLVPDPGWPNYHSAVAMAGGRAVPYLLDPRDGFTIDLERIENLITPRTRMIMMNSPSNPTGVVASEEAVRGLIALANRRGIYVLSDEIYEDMVFRGTHHSILTEGVGDHVLMVSGASKSYAMTGWRIGWLVGPDPVIDAAGRLIEPLTSCPASASQVAAEAAVRGPQDFVGMMRDTYSRAVATLTEILGPLGVIVAEPGGAFYALLDVSRTGQSADEFVRGLLDRKCVAVAPGSTFGNSTGGFVRLSTALSESEFAQGCLRIHEYFEENPS